VRKPGHVALVILLLWSIAGCSAKAPTPAARVYREPGLVKPGSYHLKFLLTGRGTLAEYLRDEKVRNLELRDFEVAGLLELLRKAFPQLYLPVQPGAPICHLETNFRHCRGIELVADLQKYRDDTVVLHSAFYYHINLRLEGDHPNFFQAAKAQRDRGEFALPNLSFGAGLTVSALYSGGKTFWEVLKEEKEFDLGRRSLELDEVEFSYTDSIARNFSPILLSSAEPVSDIVIRGIIVRLRPKVQADGIGTYPYQTLNIP
jgi:hypothetical protein